MDRISLFGIELVSGSLDEAADIIVNLSSAKAAKPYIIAHVNLSNLHKMYMDKSLATDLAANTTLLFDGIALKICALLKGLGLRPDVNGTDMIPLILRRFETGKQRVFLLGSESNTIRNATKNIEKSYPNVNIVGFHHGYFSPVDELSIIKKINQSGANVLICGMGFGKQELFSLKAREHLKISLIWCVGGLFDFLSKNKPRAPLILRRARLEWLFRLSIEPRRMSYRYSVSLIWLIYMLLAGKKTIL